MSLRGGIDAGESRSMKARLSLMMFLQFFIWGGWFVTMGSYLRATAGASGAQIAQAYSTQSWGAIIAPFIVGLLADRYFRAERVLAAIHLVGGTLMLALARQSTFAAFFPLILAYMILYMPTLALVNTLAFRQLRDPAREFSPIRVWGTVGWISAGLCISYLFAWDSPVSIAHGMLHNTFNMCGVASIFMGFYSLTLPPTPPIAHTRDQSLGERLGLDALKLLANRNFLVFFISSVLICIPLAFYYQDANQFLTELQLQNPTGKQTLGQASEVAFMLLVPFFLKRVGIKTTLLVGMLAWVVRYLLFAYGNSGERVFLLLLGIALHGVCYDFFFVSGQIYIDSKAGPQIKGAAQGLITLATYGVGMLVGFWAAGWITDHYAVTGGHQWREIWKLPAMFAASVSVLFMLTFRNENVRYVNA
jgi:nucleoside transporter